MRMMVAGWYETTWRICGVKLRKNMWGSYFHSVSLCLEHFFYDATPLQLRPSTPPPPLLLSLFNFQSPSLLSPPKMKKVGRKTGHFFCLFLFFFIIKFPLTLFHGICHAHTKTQFFIAILDSTKKTRKEK